MHFPVVGHDAQNNFLHIARWRVFAQFSQLFIESGLSDSALIHVDDKATVVAQKAENELLLSLVPLASDHDAIAIAERGRAGDHVADEFWVEAANTLEDTFNLREFDTDLGGVVDVLILAAAAFAEPGTRRVNALCGGG